jgi:6,7-dimethyl-8-ribityllumazine synthase
LKEPKRSWKKEHHISKGNSGEFRKDNMPEIEGKASAAGMHFAVVASRFNSEIVDRLVAGAKEALKVAGCEERNVTIIRVPGAFEIPLTVLRAAKSRRYDAIVAIGCVIRGETPHFEYISREASHGITLASLETGTPVGFGVLTVDTDDQAMARSEPGSTNKGFEAATAAVEMANLLKQF